jgi:hypothetical protein
VSTTAPFTVPAANSSVAVTVSSGANFAANSWIPFEANGTFFFIGWIQSIATNTLTVVNPGIEGNATSGTVPSGTTVYVVPPPGVIATTTVTALTAVNVTALLDGCLAFSLDVKDHFKLELSPANTVATTTSTVLQGGSVAAARWFRLGIANPDWQSQQTWFLSAGSGSDSNSGATSGAPLATFAELQRRVGNLWVLPASGTYTLNILGNMSDNLDLTVDVGASNASFVMQASGITPTTTGTVNTSAVAFPTGNAVATVTFNAAGFAAQQICKDVTAGTNLNAYFVTTTTLSGTQFTVTQLVNAGGAQVGTGVPTAGDTINELSLPTVPVANLTVISHASGGLGHATVQELFLSQADAVSIKPAIQGVTFAGCKVSVGCRGCVLNGSIMTSSLDPFYEDDGDVIEGANYSYFLTSAFIGTTNPSPVNTQNFIGCSFNGCTLAPASFAVFKSCQLEGTLTLAPGAFLSLSGAAGLYGSAAGINVAFYPNSTVLISSTSSCTIAVASSLRLAGVAGSPIWIKEFTSVGIGSSPTIPAQGTLTNWGTGASGLNAAPFNGIARDLYSGAAIVL